jgi:hypothetical protein
VIEAFKDMHGIEIKDIDVADMLYSYVAEHMPHAFN